MLFKTLLKLKYQFSLPTRPDSELMKSIIFRQTPRAGEGCTLRICRIWFAGIHGRPLASCFVIAPTIFDPPGRAGVMVSMPE
jgi:hypothetical protein